MNGPQPPKHRIWKRLHLFVWSRRRTISAFRLCASTPAHDLHALRLNFDRKLPDVHALRRRSTLSARTAPVICPCSPQLSCTSLLFKMKFLEIPELARLARALTHEGPECSVHTRIEAYSLKPVNKDKKLFRSLETSYKTEVSNSPPLPSFILADKEADMTPFGPMTDKSSRKTFHLLIATLNAAFPDHEFSEARHKDFNREESGASVLNALSTTLVSPNRGGLEAPRTYSAYPPTSSDFFPSSVPTSSSPLDFAKPSPYAPTKTVAGTHPSVYRILDDAIGLTDCEVYSFEPDVEYDPHANDSDGEDDAASVGDEDSSSDDEPTTFQFDDYDVDEVPHRQSGTMGMSFMSDDSDDPTSHIRMKRRGALLWSSHWFFLNKKLKRIVFITVWARSKSTLSWMDMDEALGDVKANSERFMGWEGAIGAGARAMGLGATA